MLKHWLKMSPTKNSIVREDIKICQPEKGFRFSSDSVYLAWFVRYRKGMRVIDIGSGSGVISALLCRMRGFINIDAVEYQNVMFECLCGTVRLCGLENMVNPVHADIKSFRPEKGYDIAVCNPPYRDPSTGRVPSDETELNARFTTTMSADDVFCFCRSYLNNSGSLYLSYDADMTADLFHAGFRYGFEPKRLMPVCPDIGVKPKIVLMEFRKNSGREMSFEAPLYQKMNGVQSETDKNIMTGKWINE